MSVYDESLKLHGKYHGKLKVEAKVPCEDAKDLSLAYTPGVAEPCRKIHEDKEMSYVYTNRANTVAVISDGTAVLGLGVRAVRAVVGCAYVCGMDSSRR